MITFIQNPGNSSIDIRNELIACSPFVSDNAWRTAFQRSPAMNPWHLAQALLYNSPLKQTVIHMMYHYNFDEYYTELVQNGQGGGVTDKSLLEADLVRYNSLMLAAENDYVRGYLIWEDDDEVNRISPIESHFGASYVGTDKYIKAGIKIKRGEYSAANTMLHYPVEADGHAIIQVYDPQGRQISSFTPTANGLVELPLSNCEDGVYVIQLYAFGKVVESIKLTVLNQD